MQVGACIVTEMQFLFGMRYRLKEFFSGRAEPVMFGLRSVLVYRS
jgi:hypothetical protein